MLLVPGSALSDNFRPSSSSRQNVVRSGQAKVASGNVAAESWVTAFSCTAQLDSVAGPPHGVDPA